MMKSNSVTRRGLLLGAGALAATRGFSSAWAQPQPTGTPPLFMDGHVHITNRVYWEKADFWQPQPGNWDYGRARAGGHVASLRQVPASSRHSSDGACQPRTNTVTGGSSITPLSIPFSQ